MVESDYGKQEHHNGVYAAEGWLAGVHHFVIYSLVQLLWETRMVDECPPSRNFHKTTHREDRRIAPDVNLMDHVLNDVETVLNSQTFSMQECRWYWDVRHNHLVRGMNRRVRKHSWYTRYWTTVHDKTSKHVHSKSKQWGGLSFHLPILNWKWFYSLKISISFCTFYLIYNNQSCRLIYALWLVILLSEIYLSNI